MIYVNTTATATPFEHALADTLMRIILRLVEKQNAYGGAAFEPNPWVPVSVSMKLRMLEKMSRIKQSQYDSEDSFFDLLGWGILHQMALDFEDKEVTEIQEEANKV
jgi:hypothetical protein